MGGTTPLKRGGLIVLEGCDRSGKSTQCRMLFDFLKNKGVDVKLMGFPARESNIGKVINTYLTNKQDLPDGCIHLLFSANRWEFFNEMKKLLQAGTTLVVDRYSYSGVAYSVAKGLSYDWCWSPEKGLIRPDAVFYLNTTIESLTNRENFGAERYERKEFQIKVSNVFNRIYEDEKNYWHELKANLPKNELNTEICEKTLQVLREVQDKPLMLLK